MPTRDTLGGVLHTYQKYDPARIPPPRPPATDLVSDAMERLLEFGDLDDPEALGLTEEQLAEAVEITPEQLAMLGPSLDSLKRRLEGATTDPRAIRDHHGPQAGPRRLPRGGPRGPATGASCRGVRPRGP